MFTHSFLFIFSFLIVAFGQPVWSPFLGLISACVGFSLFFRLLIDIPNPSQRFWLGTLWYAFVQGAQLFWMMAHPFWYIFVIWSLFCLFLGFQFGVFSLWIQPSFMKGKYLVSLAGLWTLMEWMRLFILSGYTWNPAGLSLSGSVYALQLASVGGIYLLTFWVMLSNLFFLKCWWNRFSISSLTVWGVLVAVPFLFGAVHYHAHDWQLKKQGKTLSVILVQTGFSLETTMPFSTAYEARLSVIEKWKKIFSVLKKYQGQSIDVIAFPEYLVPYGTYYAVFPYSEARRAFEKVFGSEVVEKLPPLSEPYAMYFPDRSQYLVDNAYFAQAISNIFNTNVLVGFEDSEQVAPEEVESYSASFWFSPDLTIPERYEKRVLVPLGEYIPFSFLNDVAAAYGIKGSFTSGKEAKVFQGSVPMGVSICYEETHGHLMRQNRLNGAELLVNLTNDGWFPYSNLPKVHFDHARFRSIESGIPLVRACNTGVTGAFNSLGEIIGVLGDYSLDTQKLCDALWVQVPAYHYSTLYTFWGDSFIVAISTLVLLALLL